MVARHGHVACSVMKKEKMLLHLPKCIIFSFSRDTLNREAIYDDKIIILVKYNGFVY